MSSWHSYPSIYNFGHRALQGFLEHELIIEEKVDGSQFSFGKFPLEVEGMEGEFDLRIRSKGAVMVLDAPEKMFTKAAETVKRIAPLLHPGWTYRGEYLAKPKHNALAYDRVPNGHIIIYDINTEEETYLDYDAKSEEAKRIGLEIVPCLYRGKLDSIETFRSFLESVSVLGGQKIEGVVAKPLHGNVFGPDKKLILAKFVSEAFKEVHKKAWGESNPTGKDILSLIGEQYRSPARWSKAIQHLREAGQLLEDPKDIGPLIKEIPKDIKKECEEEIKEQLWKWAWPHISRIATRGFPEWYKEQLVKLQFERDGVENVSNDA